MAAMTAEDILGVLRTAKPTLAARFKARELGLFGSVARAEDVSRSDIDLLVDFAEGADLLDLVGLGLYLEELLGRKVDVVARHALRPELRGAVLRELVPV
jgi:predicted nucleotidyltransferase